MKTYICKSCRHVWQSPSPALECARFGCGCRIITETAGNQFGGSRIPPNPYVQPSASGCATTAQVFLWIAAMLNLVAPVLGLLAFLPGLDFALVFSIAMPVVLVGIYSLVFLIFLPGFICGLVTLHRAWWNVQPARCGLNLAIPTPGQAVGFLFIPFFNLYWIFIAFAGLMETANALCKDREINVPPFGNGAAITLGVCFIVWFVTSWVPFLGGILASVLCILLAVVTANAARIADTTIPEKEFYL